MITYEEQNATKLSATKKDFYQIWNELLEKAQLISERWDPASTNESDPGIVLLKVLTAVADKLNYEIDVNALEAFMPSAAQEESMRKLTEMLGYNMKYYQSATTDVNISYNLADSEPIEGTIWIDKFTNVKDIDDTVNYVTLDTVYFNADTTSKVVKCIEGELIECETDDDNIVSMLQIGDNHRYYLPEVMVAENGIFVTNINNGVESEEWQQVYNLNTQKVGEHCYKFGYDSKASLPYIQFPDDISAIIEDGLRIRYIRTNGINGNVSPRTLYRIEKPASWSSLSASGEEGADKPYYDPDNYTVYNKAAAKNGANAETLNNAYSNYKKTIGTFDTLVTCRDYMNKIYQLTTDSTDTINLVSNIIVSDIRDDVNKAMMLCTFGDYGIEYNNVAIGDSKISPFDLVFYPFKNIYGLNSKTEYVKSFKYDDSNLLEIKNDLEGNKTLAHNIITPDDDDLACIKNYYRLNAKITTNYRLNVLEQADVLNSVYSKLYENFNMRRLDFGEEIPYDDILAVITTADPRIKSVSLEDPDIVTRYCAVDGSEYATSTDSTSSEQEEVTVNDGYYNKLALRNVLAGRIPIFDYNENFKPEYNESAYAGYDLLYPESLTPKTEGIKYLKPAYTIEGGAKNIKLTANEVVQFRLPNIRTTKTYPAYVNYFIHLNTESDVPAIPATMLSIRTLLADPDLCEAAANSDTLGTLKTKDDYVTSAETWATEKEKYVALFTPDEEIADKYVYSRVYVEGKEYYYIPLSSTTFGIWDTWVRSLPSAEGGDKKLLGLYWGKPIDLSKNYGRLVDTNHRQYLPASTWNATSTPFDSYYVQETHPAQDPSAEPQFTADGLGQDPSLKGIGANEEYKLTGDEYLLINYTSSSSTESGDSKTVISEIYTEKEHYVNGQKDQDFIGYTFIRPNFELIDSKKYRSLHKYSKTSGYDFNGITEITQPDGMFTLDSNQQIELRDFVVVTLNKQATNIY